MTLWRLRGNSFRHLCASAPLREYFCLLFAVLLAATSYGADAPRPNIVFVLVDDMGYADLGCMGAKDIKTPNIDRLATEGLKFTDFYANAPVCTPTRTAFMTGRWQQRVGFEWAMGFTAEQFRRVNGKLVEEPDKLAFGLPSSETTIAELLKPTGYATGAFGKWHLGYQPEHNPTRRGFDEYFGVLLGHADYYRYNYFDGTYELRDGEQPVKAEGYLTDLINQRAIQFVRKHAKDPFFLYVPYNAVHSPYQPPNRPLPAVTKENMYDGTRQDYAAMLEKIDEGVGMLLTELQKQGILDNTLFVLSSDNGGERLSDNTPLFHHKQSLFEGGIRVPCLMRWPAKLPRGKLIPCRRRRQISSPARWAESVANPHRRATPATSDLLLARQPLHAQSKSHPPRRVEIHQRWRRRFALQPQRRHRRAPRPWLPKPVDRRRPQSPTQSLGRRNGPLADDVLGAVGPICRMGR
jgi:arylsulfatase A-like enzyme